MKYQKITSQVITSVIGFIQPFASKRLIKGMEYLLKQCCVPGITSVDFTCTDTNEATITILLDESPGFTTNAFAQAFSTVDGFLGAGTFDGVRTITIEGATVTAGDAAFTVTLFYPTNESNSSKGVYLITSALTATVPTCA